MSDFGSVFHSFEEQLRTAAGGVMSKIDMMTFKMLINNLKSTDFQTVMDTLDQLGKEKRPISIPPIYFLSEAHPDNRIRVKAGKVLASIVPKAELDALTSGKEPKDAVGLLIQKYGNFKSA